MKFIFCPPPTHNNNQIKDLLKFVIKNGTYRKRHLESNSPQVEPLTPPLYHEEESLIQSLEELKQGIHP